MSKDFVNVMDTVPTHFGDMYKVDADGADAIIVLFNIGGGWQPYRMLLPHQLYEKDVQEQLNKIGRSCTIAYVPIHTEAIRTVAQS